MNAGMEPHPVSRMTLPSPGGAIGAVVVLVFVLFFSSLAAYHIVHFADTPTFGIVAAVFWLAFVTLIGREAVYSRGGVRGFIVACLGRFSSRHFVEALREGERTVISFGFELLRRKF